MKGISALGTFALTTAVIGLIIGLSLRSGNAQFGSSSETSVVHSPVFSISHGDTAHIFIVNHAADPTGPPATFTTVFLDGSGNPAKPPVTCRASAGQMCDMPISFNEGCAPNAKGG